MIPIRIPMTISSNQVSMPMQISAEYGIVTVDTYKGETTVTPSETTQVLHTAGLLTETDITINPIPSNYGLITWSGSVLTVS